MRTIATTLAAMLAAVLAAAAFAQETTIKVPQGSGVFPTVGQVNCLEEMGSGRLCAATYECSGESGRLWGDLANHDGRRAIGEDSPVARGRDCTITVDGRAAVRWLTGYSPRRNSELVGLTTSADALRPVVRGGSTSTATGEDGRPLLAYILERHNTTLADLAGFYCEAYAVGSGHRAACVDSLLRQIFDVSYRAGVRGPADISVGADGSAGRVAFSGSFGFADLQENSVTRCLVELYETPYFCTALTARRFGRDSCDDNRLMAYHLLSWAALYSTFETLDNDNTGFGELDRLVWSLRSGSQQCATAAVDRLQQTYGVELIEYVIGTGEGILTISE